MYIIERLNITQQRLSIICVSGAVQGPGDAAKDTLFPAFRETYIIVGERDSK